MPATHHTWNRWWIVFAAMLGLIVGQGSINVFAAGVFLKPVAQELGFGRGDHLYNRKSSYHSIGSLVLKPQQRLYFWPLPHGQGSLRPIFRAILGPVIVSLLRLRRYGEGRPRHKQWR